MDSTKETNAQAEEEQKTAEETNVQAEQEEPTKITKKDSSSSLRKGPRKVEAGKLSAISRAAKKRQQEIQRELNPDPVQDESFLKPLLYFGIPSIFLAGMFLLSTRREAKKEVKKEQVVVEQPPKSSIVKNISLFE